MASDICTMSVTGRITRDAELKHGRSGTAICQFSIASNYSKKQGENWSEEVSFFDCVMFGRRAEALNRYMRKGQQLALRVSPRQERWEKDGQKRSAVKLYVDDVVLVGSKSTSQKPEPSHSSTSSDFDDDVPF